MDLSDLKNLIINAAWFPHLSSVNFRLALAYYELGQTAAAATFFLKAAEIQLQNENLNPHVTAYAAMLLAGECFEKQGRRDVSAKTCYLHAVNIYPDRPEAYFFLSRLYQKIGKYPDAYTYATIGLTKHELPYPELETKKTSYPGEYGLYYQKAVAAWWWGKTQESIDLFNLILNYYDSVMTDEYRQSIHENLARIDPNYKKKSDSEFAGKVAIIVQGPYHPEFTMNILEKYLSYSFVDEVIFSTWEYPSIPDQFPSNPKLKVITSKNPKKGPGIDNRNNQIVSSLAGLNATMLPISFKIRSDQLFSENTLIDYLVTFSKNRSPNKIFSFGEFSDLLYHPCDHMFLGETNDLRLLFSAPEEDMILLERCGPGIPKEELYKYYHCFIRSETYLGLHYCARFVPTLYKYLVMPDKYLYDGAPEWWPVKKESEEIYPKYFESLPKPIDPVLWYRPGRKVPIEYPINDIPLLKWKPR